jgi:hypothetical protein
LIVIIGRGISRADNDVSIDINGGFDEFLQKPLRGFALLKVAEVFIPAHFLDWLQGL